MSDHPQPDEQLGDAEMERLLASVVGDAAVTFPHREHLRRRMLAVYASSATEVLSTSMPSGSVPQDHPSKNEPPVEIIAFDLTSGHGVGPERRRLPLVAAAALLLAGTVVGFMVLRNPSTDLSASMHQQLAPEDADFPVSIAAGLHGTDAVGPNITLRLPGGVEVLEERPGLVVLGRSGDQSDPRARVSIVSPGAGGSLVELITELEAQGLLKPIESRTMANQQLAVDWELRLTNEAADRFGCVAAGPCVLLGPIELWSRGVNYITEIAGPEGSVLWWVEQASVHQDPFLEDATAMLGSLRFE